VAFLDEVGDEGGGDEAIVVDGLGAGQRVGFGLGGDEPAEGFFVGLVGG
jgi:hypothetical protein